MEPAGPLRRVDAALGRTVPVGAGLAALAVSHPVLDLFGQHPTFFVARSATDGEILAFGCLVAFVPALAAITSVAVAAAVHERLGAAAHHLVVALLGALLVATVLLPRSSGGVLFVIGSVAAGALLAVAGAHLRGLREAFDCLTPLPVVVLALFAFTSPTARLLWQPAAAAAPAHHVQHPDDVALLVLDELPLASLLRADGRIDAARFPNFARLAASGTWYRNASSSYAWTETAVPSVLTGRRPPPDAVPTAVDHPRNLFTLLAGSHRMNVVEAVTDLCPPDVCADTGPLAPEERVVAAGPLRALLDAAVVYGHQVIPGPWSSRLPVIEGSWGGFEATGAPGDLPAPPPAGSPSVGVGRVAPAMRLLQGLGSGTGPRLDVAHVVLPHAPWALLPSGQEYGATLEGLTYEPEARWTADEALVRRAQARHLLQVGFVDALLGRLLDRLEHLGRLDRTVVAVVADHGAAFTPGLPMREPTPRTQDEVFRVPLIIKAPGQRTGTIDDRPAQTVDLVPTLVDLLGVQTRWEFDGAPLTPTGARPDPVVIGPDGAVHPLSTGLEPLMALAQRNQRRFPATRDWRGVFAAGPLGPHVGRPVSALPRAEEATAWTWSSAEAPALASVDLDSSYLPVQVTGTLAGEGVDAGPEQVLLALNGTVAGVGDVTWTAGGDGHVLALVDPSHLRPGANAVTVLVPDADGEGFVRARQASEDPP